MSKSRPVIPDNVMSGTTKLLMDYLSPSWYKPILNILLAYQRGELCFVDDIPLPVQECPKCNCHVFSNQAEWLRAIERIRTNNQQDQEEE